MKKRPLTKEGFTGVFRALVPSSESASKRADEKQSRGTSKRRRAGGSSGKRKR
jgi:hypothetical protein